MKKILVFGTGDYMKKFQSNIEQKFEIVGFLDNYVCNDINGKPIYKPTEKVLKEVPHDYILIMVQSIKTCFELTRYLLMFKCIKTHKIQWGIEFYGDEANKIQKMDILLDGRIKIDIKNTKIILGSEDEYFNTMDTLYNECYKYSINNNKKDIVLDIGMNIADSTLYFLKNENIEKIYAYEPFKQTYTRALTNLGKYKTDSRLELNCYGLSNKTEMRTLTFQEDMTCGLSTLENMFTYVHHQYMKSKLISDTKETFEMVHVKEAALEIAQIVQKHKNCNFIMKMDCEGEEYNILSNLIEKNFLMVFDFIMLEWHYKGRKSIEDFLCRGGYSYHSIDKSEEMGMIYAWKQK